ncbi:hypothetical protein NSK_008060 [Nannochloropsis salina CCMP1776]|uniref:GOLD domain-containing protein n=1 Tax=Nannochloropsis salina CCMP1776 TaxID=1027361 RepID=A0A4D9CQ77_9STRA|nr:hypothetical protein NSK_008060 [Nannochloropsis salina CCMP1776]|eukprot:TFJ80634.1 hypothetical protein NSK_008060 [Nannochloropsis salina CCMP1776]
MFLFGGHEDASNKVTQPAARQHQERPPRRSDQDPVHQQEEQQAEQRQRAEDRAAEEEKETHDKALLLMSAKQRGFLSYEEHEYRKHLAELDAALTAAVPQAGLPCHTHDLAWKSSGTPVRYYFKLPVPVDTAGSHVAYRFASDEFDIGFAVFFQGAEEGAKLETVLPSSRVDSHVEPVSGDITVHRPGTVVLLWDNSYSWFATKALSYSVHLRYPTGPAAEMERGMRARQVVAAAYHDMELAAGKHRVVQSEKEALTGEVTRLEEELARLHAQLSEKRHELATLHEDALLLQECRTSRHQHLLPLLLRALPARVLLHLTSYFHRSDQVHALNKVFLQLFIQSRPGYQRPPSLSVSASSSSSTTPSSSSSPPSSIPPPIPPKSAAVIRQEEIDEAALSSDRSGSLRPQSTSLPPPHPPKNGQKRSGRKSLNTEYGGKGRRMGTGRG